MRQPERGDVQDFGALLREVGEAAHCTAGDDLPRKCVRGRLESNGYMDGKRLTVEKMAAGTLKMTLMMAFRFNRMNTTASRFEKKLCAASHQLSRKHTSRAVAKRTQ